MVRLLVLFPLLGLFAWWIFTAVSLPPTLRDLFEEDQAIATAATPPSEEDTRWAELAKLPSPPQRHAPEVISLLQRLASLPPLPYVLSQALAREATLPPGQPPPPWTEEEKTALEKVRRSYLQAWEPFFQGSPPDWPNYPDSVMLFRSSYFLLSRHGEMAGILAYQPGQIRPPRSFPEAWDVPELMLPLLRQCRNLGSLRFGQQSWEISETVSTAALLTECVGALISAPGLSRNALEFFRNNLGPAPTLEDLRAGLAADRAVFLRTADFLEKLPPTTPADIALFRLLPEDMDPAGYLRAAENVGTASQLAAQLRQDADRLEVLRQRTFLTGPAWRQWLSQNPGREFGPLLAEALGGFQKFEDVRMGYLVALAGLEARMAWETGGLPAARRIPDPVQPGSFLTVEETPEGVRVASAHVPEGQTVSISYLIPVEAGGRR